MSHKTLLRQALWCAAFALAVFSCKNEKKVPEGLAVPADEALIRLNALLENDPENDSLLYLRGRAYYRLEAYDEALQDIGHALSIDSLNHPNYYHLMADVLLDYARPNDSKRALEVLDKGAQRFPNHTHTWLKLSEFYLIVQRHTEALKCLDHILQRDPQNAEAFFMAGRVALDQRDTLRATTSFKKAVQIDASIGDAWIFLGRIYTTKLDPQAIQCFDNAIRLDSTNLEAREFKASFYLQKGEYDKAFPLYREIVNLDQNYTNAFFDMGVMYLNMDSLDKAYDNFDIAIKTDPLYVGAYYYRGMASELKGNQDAAIADYRQANKMSPSMPEPKAALERLKAK